MTAQQPGMGDAGGRAPTTTRPTIRPFRAASSAMSRHTRARSSRPTPRKPPSTRWRSRAAAAGRCASPARSSSRSVSATVWPRATSSWPAAAPDGATPVVEGRQRPTKTKPTRSRRQAIRPHRQQGHGPAGRGAPERAGRCSTLHLHRAPRSPAADAEQRGAQGDDACRRPRRLDSAAGGAAAPRPAAEPGGNAGASPCRASRWSTASAASIRAPRATTASTPQGRSRSRAARQPVVVKPPQQQRRHGHVEHDAATASESSPAAPARRPTGACRRSSSRQLSRTAVDAAGRASTPSATAATATSSFWLPFLLPVAAASSR